MKTINIKGKEYVPVVERVKEFHKEYPAGQIITEIISNEQNRIIVKAIVKVPIIKKEFIGLYAGEDKFDDKYGYNTFTGHSQSEWGKGMMGDVALEVAETSAVGRALGFAGIGIDTGIASADEMRKVKTVAGQTDEDVPF